MTRTFAIAGLGTLLSCGLFGQAATSTPTFEVASVKTNQSGPSEPTGDAKNGRFILRNCPMFVLVARAYQVSFDRVSGPEWMYTERYDIDAKFPPDTSGDTLWLMVQNLLAERFKLTIHHDQNPVPVWALLVGKKGPKLPEASAESQPKSGCRRQGAQLVCQNQRMTMAELAENLPHWVSRNYFAQPVVDQTGLTGAYDFSLTWTPTNRPDDAVDPAGVSLFDAIEQLGLKLEERKAPLDRIVIDRLERIPTGN